MLGNSRRQGTTLMEVLIAIFVTAIGLLAMLALFPLGAYNMAQAIKDDRCALASSNAAAIAQTMHLASDSYVVPTGGNNPFTQGNGTGWPDMTTTPGYKGPSYPVYVDPQGTSILGAGSTLGSYSTSPPNSPGMSRKSTSYGSSSTAQYLRWFALLDDMTFEINGTPAAPGGEVQREDRYTWAYLLQRPNWKDASTTNMTVVVYSGRSNSTPGENTYYTDLTAGTNYFTIYLNQIASNGKPKPAIRKGQWILDATVVTNSGAYPDPHGNFYRVVNVTESVGTIGVQQVSTMVVELQTNIKHGTTPNTGQGVICVLENVAEVFEKGPLNQY